MDCAKIFKRCRIRACHIHPLSLHFREGLKPSERMREKNGKVITSAIFSPSSEHRKRARAVSVFSGSSSIS